MINVLTDLPSNVVGFEAVGHVSADDYRDVLEPTIAKALQENDKLRLLYVLGEKFEGYSAGAAWQDTKLGINHWNAWERIAVVTDRAMVRDGVRAFAWIVPGEVRVFSIDEGDDARGWVAADD
jgi:SpoIIAA-like